MDVNDTGIRMNQRMDFHTLLALLEKLPPEIEVTVDYIDSTLEPAVWTGKAGKIIVGLRELGGWN